MVRVLGLRASGLGFRVFRAFWSSLGFRAEGIYESPVVALILSCRCLSEATARSLLTLTRNVTSHQHGCSTMNYRNILLCSIEPRIVYALIHLSMRMSLSKSMSRSLGCRPVWVLCKCIYISLLLCNTIHCYLARTTKKSVYMHKPV